MSDIPAANQNLDYLVSLATEIAQSHQNAWTFYPIAFAVIVGLIFVITQHTQWISFADNHKWGSRIVLFVLLFITLIMAGGTSHWVFYRMKGKLSPEFPLLTSTAIKIGLYRLELQQELGHKIAAEQKDLMNCVIALSTIEGNKYLNSCEGDAACIHALPPPSKDEIINNIRGIQAGKIPTDAQTQVCKNVKLGS